MENINQNLKEAYEAGVKSVKQNEDRDRKLESGVKHIEKEYTFENWLNNSLQDSIKSEKRSASKIVEVLKVMPFNTDKELREFVNESKCNVSQIILRQDIFTWILFYYG